MRILIRLLTYLRKYGFLVALALICALIVAGLNLIIPWFIKDIIDRALVQKHYELLMVLSLSIVGITALKGIFSFVQSYLMAYVSQKVIYDLRNAMYSHLQRLSFSFYDTAQTGQLMSRVTSDVDALHRFLGFGVVRLTSSGLIFLGILTVCLYLNWKLALVALSSSPLLISTVLRFGRKVRPVFYTIRQQFAELTAVLQENVTGVRVVKTFARETYETEKFSAKATQLFQKRLEAAKLWAYYFPYMNFLSSLGTTLILWYGGYQVIQGTLTLGELVAFNTYLLMLIMPIQMFGFVVYMLQNAIASGERIFEIMDTQSDVQEAPDAVPLSEIEGHVCFEGVSFQYPGGQVALKDVDLDVRSGQIVALLGATGSGKSTIIHLIPRFYDPTSGRITVDGVDIRKVTLASLRRQIGIVLQETFLFSASIRENIAYGRTDASMTEIKEVARAARIHDFVVGLPEQYETQIGERGITLSGGQRQRVAIARALLMDPRILILDDATSSVDTETEHLIQEALSELMRGRTTFVIAQRMSTVKRADEIVVLKDGEIVERGTHEELMAQGGLYGEIYNTQLRDEPIARSST